MPIASDNQQLCVLFRTGRHQYRRAITSCLELTGAGSTPPKILNGYLGVLAIIIQFSVHYFIKYTHNIYVVVCICTRLIYILVSLYFGNFSAFLR